jgi:hypothetical protein
MTCGFANVRRRSPTVALAGIVFGRVTITSPTDSEEFLMSPTFG